MLLLLSTAFVAPVTGPIPGNAHGAATGERTGGVEFSEREKARLMQLSPRRPLPPDETNRVADDPGAALLGQRLFFDTRLSGNAGVSCATCHDPSNAFTDGRAVAHGVGDGRRNTPTLLNAAWQRWYFWDGRADTLWSQALEPLEDPLEMGGDRVSIARLIVRDPLLRREYEAIFGAAPALDDEVRFPAPARPVSTGDAQATPDAAARAWDTMSEADREVVNGVFVNVGKAIAAYVRRLNTGDAPFDRFVEGLRANDPALLGSISAAAQRGAQLFIGAANCRLCHNGPLLSDGEFHSIGFTDDERGDTLDPGRYEGAQRLARSAFGSFTPSSDAPDGSRAALSRAVRQSTETWGQFRTPSLREVARTAPYGHHGQVSTLREVVEHYSTLETARFPGHHRESILVPLNLSPQEVDDLVAFLESLSGTLPEAELLSPPPASDPAMTRADTLQSYR